MFGKYFKTFCKAFNTPPVSLIRGLNETYELLSKLSRGIEASKRINVQNASLLPLDHQHTLPLTFLKIRLYLCFLLPAS